MTTPSPARTAALEVLRRVRERDAYAHETLNAVLNSASLSPRDGAFATRIAYGTIACRGTLEEAIRGHAGPDRVIDPDVEDALCLSAYEMLFTRTPARAAVSEGVELVRTVRPKAAGFANAVLRRVAESVDDFPWGDPETDTAALARLHGHPQWLTSMWVEQLGAEKAASVMDANNEPAPLYLAHMPFSDSLETVMDALERAGAEPSSCPVPGCVQTANAAAAISSVPLSRYSVMVADAAAQLTAAAVPLSDSGLVIEIGAGRGTKSLMIAGRADLLGSSTDVLAVDIHKFKLEALSRIAETVGAKRVSVRQADATTPEALAYYAGKASSVLIDAPCSGLGTLRRHPDRRWRAQPAEIESLAALGASLLSSAATLVCPGGFMVYSTCTIARQENEDVIEGFLSSEAGKDYVIDSLAGDVPEEWSHFLSPEGLFQSLPAHGGPDGHFIARLRRNS